MKNQKPKRIKKVFGNASEVLHRWANQSQSDARSRNVFFEGTRVYSYGHHYLLGELVDFNGVRVAVINDSGYSNTTAKHIHWAWSAVDGMPRVKAHDFDVKAGLIRTQGELVDELMGFFSRRSFWSDEQLETDSWLMERIADFNKTCKAVGLDTLVLDVPQDFKDLVNSHAKLARERVTALNSPEALAARQAKAAKRAATAIQSWRAGGPLTEAVRNLRPMLLRVHAGEVQTSGGASVPLDAALRLLNRVESGTAESGEKVGAYTLTRVEGSTVRIGCHVIALDEARAVLASLNKAA